MESEDKFKDERTRKKLFGLTIGLIVTGVIAVVLLGVLIWSVNDRVSDLLLDEMRNFLVFKKHKNTCISAYLWQAK